MQLHVIIKVNYLSLVSKITDYTHINENLKYNHWLISVWFNIWNNYFTIKYNILYNISLYKWNYPWYILMYKNIKSDKNFVSISEFQYFKMFFWRRKYLWLSHFINTIGQLLLHGKTWNSWSKLICMILVNTNFA